MLVVLRKISDVKNLNLFLNNRFMFSMQEVVKKERPTGYKSSTYLLGLCLTFSFQSSQISDRDFEKKKIKSWPVSASGQPRGAKKLFCSLGLCASRSKPAYFTKTHFTLCNYEIVAIANFFLKQNRCVALDSKFSEPHRNVNRMYPIQL